MAGIESFINCRPINSKEKPRTKLPQYCVCLFLFMLRRKPQVKRGKAIVDRLILKPSSDISQAVTVVPILAPIMTAMDSGSVSKAAFAKPTTINVVAEDDCTSAVKEKPVTTARKRLAVAFASIVLRRSPAKFIKASLMTFMP